MYVAIAIYLMSYCLTLIEHWACSSKFWCLCCIYFRYHSLSLPQTWLHFRHGALLLPTCLPWLKSLQALRRTISNAVLSLQLGQTKHVGKENVSAAHQIVWAAKGHSPIRTPINRGHPQAPLKSPHSQYFWQWATSYQHFKQFSCMGLSLIPIIQL